MDAVYAGTPSKNATWPEAGTNDEEVPESAVEDELRRRARIGTGEHDHERVLALDERRTAGLGAQRFETLYVARETGVSGAHSFERRTLFA